MINNTTGVRNTAVGDDALTLTPAATLKRESGGRKKERKTLDEREKTLAENEKSTTNARAIPPDVESQSASRDPAQLKAERDKIIQQVSAEIRALIPDDSKMKGPKGEGKTRAKRPKTAWAGKATEAKAACVGNVWRGSSSCGGDGFATSIGCARGCFGNSIAYAAVTPRCWVTAWAVLR